MKYLETMIPILKLGEEKREVVERLCYDITDLNHVEDERLKLVSVFHIIYNILNEYNIKPINRWYSYDKEYFDDKLSKYVFDFSGMINPVILYKIKFIFDLNELDKTEMEITFNYVN